MSESIMVTPTPRDPAQHELKTWPAYFGAVASGRKSFEIRRDDRPFRTGDTLRLREWCPVEQSYTGREVVAEVTYLMRKEEDFGLMAGFCLMGIRLVAEAAALTALRAGTHVVVPRERTEAMHQGAQSTTGAIITRRHSAEIWAAMLAAAPEPGHD